MNRHPFSDVTRSFLSRPSRRHLVGLVSVLGGSGIVRFPLAVTARKNRKRKKRKKHPKPKVRFNAFGCIDVGEFCQSNGQCCSNICTGATGKKTCQAHDTGGCQIADDACLHEEAVVCPVEASRAQTSMSANKALAFCFQTTGRAAFCGFPVSDQCVACAKDADCIAPLGAGAACVLCANGCAETNHTTCMPAQI